MQGNLKRLNVHPPRPRLCHQNEVAEGAIMPDIPAVFNVIYDAVGLCFEPQNR